MGFDQSSCGKTHLSIEDGLYLDFPSKVELFGLRFRPFIPFLEDFSESGRIEFDELLVRRSVPMHTLPTHPIIPIVLQDLARVAGNPPPLQSIRHDRWPGHR